MLCFMQNKLSLCNKIIIKSFWYFCSCLTWEWPETIGGWARLSSPMVADQKRTMASSAISSQTRPDMIEIPINQNWMRRNTLSQSGQIWMTKSGKYCTPIYPTNKRDSHKSKFEANKDKASIGAHSNRHLWPSPKQDTKHDDEDVLLSSNTMFNSYKCLTCITETMFDLIILYYPLDLLE